MLMLECPGCQVQFPWAPNQKYHNTQCRRKHDEKLRLEKDNQLWVGTYEIEYSQEQAWKDVNTRVAEVLGNFAKTDAKFYRLGCPKNNAKAPFSLRWFPSRGAAKIFLSLAELPRDVPLPGLYLVALFTEAKVLINEPAFKLPVPGFDPRLQWSSGTLKP